MRPFRLDEYKSNPNQTIILQHYKETNGRQEHWVVDEVELVMGSRLAIRMPETGYETSVVEFANGADIRDNDHNLVGTLWFGEPKESVAIAIYELSRLANNLKVGESIDFNCDEDSNHWGIVKLHVMDHPVLIIGRYGGGYTELFDIEVDTEAHEITTWIESALEDSAGDIVYYEVPNPKTNEQ